MTKFYLLIPLLAFHFYALSQGVLEEDEEEFLFLDYQEYVATQEPIEAVVEQRINHVNIYPNDVSESFVIDFHDKGFSSVTIFVRDEIGKTFYAVDLGEINAGDFKEIALPKDMDNEVVYVTVVAEGQELVQIFHL